MSKLAPQAARRPLTFSTASAEAAARFLQATFSGDVHVAPLAPSKPLHIASHVAPDDKVVASVFRFGNVSLRQSFGAALSILFPLGDADAALVKAGVRTVLSSEAAYVLGPGETVSFEFRKARAKLLVVDLAALAARVETLTGCAFDIGETVQRAGVIDMRSPIGSSLLRSVRGAMADARDFPTGLYPATRERSEKLLTLVAAALLPGDAVRETSSDRAYLRTLRDHIAAHCHGPICLTTLAGELGVPMRTLQEQFRKAYGLSARDFIRQSRLERAHALLRSAETGVNVTAVALASGFNDLADFSRSYRLRYNETPSQTLRSTRLYFTPAGAKRQNPRLPA